MIYTRIISNQRNLSKKKKISPSITSFIIKIKNIDDVHINIKIFFTNVIFDYFNCYTEKRLVSNQD